MGKLPIENKRRDCFWVKPEDLTIITDPEHPLYNPEALDEPSEEMVQNVMANGVIQSITVAKDGDEVIVVAGRQRVKAAMQANNRLQKQGANEMLVPCLLRMGNEVDYYGLSISENHCRRDNDQLQKADKLKRFLAIGGSPEEAAQHFCVSVQTINSWLEVGSLSEPVKQAIREGKTTATRARKLAGQSIKAQKSKIKTITTKVNAGKTDTEIINSGKKRKRTRKYAEVLEISQKCTKMPNEIRVVFEWFLNERADLPFVDWKEQTDLEDRIAAVAKENEDV
jgi:ParB family chromosome partitioning protein